MKDLFTGALGRLNNHGGSKIYTTPNTILVPPEYEIEIGEHGNFISCSLDGRLWLFEDRIVALKWNKEAGKMEFATSKSFSDETFVARGRDWILTDSSVIQVTYENPYIFYETHNEDVTPMEHFYSLLPALDGFQIVKNFLIRKPNADYENLMYPISTANIFLIPYGEDVWGKISNKIGLVTITNEDNNYLLDITQEYSTSDSDITGIAFLGDSLYGFQNDENNKGLCLSSQNLNLYSFEKAAWEILSENTGKIYFDMFNNKGLALHEKGMELLPDKKSVKCNTLAQWIAPSKEIHYVSDDILISAFGNTTLATNVNSEFYREILKDKELPLSTASYQKTENKGFRLAVGDINYKIGFNNLLVDINITENIDFTISLIKTFPNSSASMSVIYIGKNENGNLEYGGFIDISIDEYFDRYVSIIPVFQSLSPIYSYFYPQVVWDSDYATYNDDVYELSTKVQYNFFYINFDTGEIIEKSIDIALPYHVEYTIYFPDGSYISNPFITRQTFAKGPGFFDYGDHTEYMVYIRKVSFELGRIIPYHLKYPISEEKSFFTLFSVENAWKKFIISDNQEEFSRDRKNIIFINNYFAEPKEYIDFIYFNGHKQKSITKRFYFTSLQKEVLAQYPFLRAVYNYYNIKKSNKFFHVLVYSNDIEITRETQDTLGGKKGGKGYESLFLIFCTEIKE